MSDLHILALYGAKSVSFCISDKKFDATAKQRIDLPRSAHADALVEKLVAAYQSHDALVKALQGMLAVTDHWHDSDGEFLKSGARNPRFVARAALTAAGAA